MKFSPRAVVPAAALLCAFTATATAQVQQVIHSATAPEKAEKRQDLPVKWTASDFIASRPSPSGQSDRGTSGRSAIALSRSLPSSDTATVTVSSVAAPVNVVGLGTSAAMTGPDFSLPSAPASTAMEAHTSGTSNAVPEPGSVFLIGAGLAGVLLLRRQLNSA